MAGVSVGKGGGGVAVWVELLGIGDVGCNGGLGGLVVVVL